ncbi:MAG: aminotransferase V [Chromatiales bacterium 21-64-14]|nr:MAG: aminotransferase V [Chromatiales bacterium 21-64-14]
MEPGGGATDARWKKGICGVCPAGCWVEVCIEGGRLTDIRADPDHPLGALCRRGRHAQEIVYGEHRLRYPLRRSGVKGGFAFERIGWDGAYDEIVQRLERIKSESGPEAVAVYTGRGAFELSLCDLFQPKGVAVSSASNVLFPFGSPNTMGVGALCYVSFAMIAPHVTMGRMLIDMYADMENAELLVVWGANPATDSPPMDMRRLETAARRGADIVVIDPRRTETVERCGAEWIAIRPGTDGALALSMIGVLIDEGILDEEFAENWCRGFDELAQYVQHFPPDAAERITGVPAQTVRTLARRIGTARGACPVMYTGLEYSDSGVQAIRAVLTLFALAGQLDVPGGIGLAMRGSHFPINRSCNQANPDLARAAGRERFPLYSHYRGESHATALVDAVLKGRPYPIRALIIHGASLLTSWPQPALWRRVLEKLDFVVCIDRQRTADAAFADLVLPATTMFEIDSYMAYGPIFRLREKLIEPVGEARNDYRIMAQLAARLGYGDLYPQTEEALLRFVLEGSGFTLEDVRAAGGTVRIPSPFTEYRKWEKGGLRADGRPGFDTPSGKFEIRSSMLEEYGYEPLPRYTEPREGPLADPVLAREFPLIFNSGARPDTDFRSQHHGIAGLVKDNPEPTVQINDRDASARGIRDGDLAEVRTPRGAVPFRTRVSSAIVAGAVECNMGGGTPVGPPAWREWNVNALTDLDHYDAISGFPVYKALLCEVVKLADGAPAGTGSRRAERHGARRVGRAAGAVAVSQRRPVYLDNNATTPVDPLVREAMLSCLDAGFGNPSSLHRGGREAHAVVETARRSVARLINVRPRRVIFTSGGSESNNLAIKGVALVRRGRGGHVVTTRIEHPSVLGACAFLETLGYAVTYLQVDRWGRVDPGDVAAAIRDDTVLVSIMTANNEVGTIQPIRECCWVAHGKGVLFHTDAVQAVGKIPVDVADLDVDLLSLSAHKFHGPKGIGALYVRKGVTPAPLVHGGGQEGSLRGGTQNVAGIAGLGAAAERAVVELGDCERVRALRDRFEAELRKLVSGAVLNGHPEQRLPNTLNMTLPGLRGESLVVALDQNGVAASSGSACKSGSPEPTHVLIAMGVDPQEAHCSLRFSLSRYTTDEDVDAAVAALREVLGQAEATVRFLPCK